MFISYFWPFLQLSKRSNKYIYLCKTIHKKIKQAKFLTASLNLVKKEEPSVARSSRRQSINTTMESAAGISSKSSTTSSQSTVPGSNPGSSLNPPAASPTTPQAIQVLRDLQEWRLVPDSIYRDSAKKPLESLVYGPIHLLRLFVKLPESLSNSC